MNWTDIASTSVTIFLIMDPFGNAPVFNAVLSGLDSRRRAIVVARELIIALFILFGFLITGNTCLDFLGLKQPSLNISGGILLFIISLRMIFPSSKGGEDNTDIEDTFIVPLAVPLIAGPSTIAVLLLLSSTRPERLIEWSISLFLAWLGTTILLVASPLLLRMIGSRGSRALERLMGMILVFLAVQMLLNGIQSFVMSL